jgi:hypothetical protein
LERVRRLLERQGSWTIEWQAELESQASETIESAVDWAESIPEPTFEEMLNRMYATPTAPLREQLGLGGKDSGERPLPDPPPSSGDERETGNAAHDYGQEPRDG